MNFNVGCATDVGRKRSQNQDRVKVAPELGLFIVADGMGGHRGGETASAMVVELVPEIVKQAQETQGPQWNPKNVISKAIEGASRAIHERAISTPALQGMGTTTVAMLFKDNLLTIGHVGDSRCYFLRPGAIWQATRDHSLVQEKLRAGLISRAELKTDRMKNVITRSVGFEADVNVEIYEMSVQPGDVFLICSDGLSGMIDDEEMLEVIQKSREAGHPLTETVQDLIDAANQNGGEDNVSTIMVEITG
jgi:protein phosphatase